LNKTAHLEGVKRAVLFKAARFNLFSNFWTPENEQFCSTPKIKGVRGLQPESSWRDAAVESARCDTRRSARRGAD
jgi:hypothetical protein